jgi:hypothetical protein
VHQVEPTVGEQTATHVDGDITAHRAVRHGHGNAGTAVVAAAADRAIVA